MAFHRVPRLAPLSPAATADIQQTGSGINVSAVQSNVEFFLSWSFSQIQLALVLYTVLRAQDHLHASQTTLKYIDAEKK